MKVATGIFAPATFLIALPAMAQEMPPRDEPAPEISPPEKSSPEKSSEARQDTPPTEGGSTVLQSYTPSDFERYAPKNAYDMLQHVPGFAIRDSEQMRGLGQATGNVLFNGERPSNKSDNLFTLLSRIPAGNVQRIEIVDGATLDIPGLAGQVANIIFQADAFSGQFSWKPEFRAHYTDPLLSRGDISISGRKGKIEYEVSLSNDNSARNGAGGPTLILDDQGDITETRDDIWTSDYDSPKLSASITWDGPGDTVGHLNGHYQRIYDNYKEDGMRFSPGQPDRFRTVRDRGNSWNYEIGADYEFALGPGRLKLIGLRRFSNEPYSQEIIVSTNDGAPDRGDRFTQSGKLGETIGRGEYKWKMLGGDWEWSAEAAFNTLENMSGLFSLNPMGDFVELPFPGGSGRVSEDRYESLLSYSRKLTGTLSVQLLAGAENSTIRQSGANGLTRTFLRPKGSLTFAWTPASGFDVSLKIRRRVLQLSFYDFLARAFLNDNNQNVSNNDLRPQQDWSYEAEANKTLGKWGSTKLRLIYRDVEDYVDIIPIGNGEAVGNIATSWAGAIEWISTINFDPAGLKGVKLDTRLLFQKSRLPDPFTGESRSWSGFTDRVIEFDLRHDISGTDWAWGVSAQYLHSQPRYRSNQSDRIWEGPVFAYVFVEHKDVLGLTVRAAIDNVLDARSRRDRIVYTGLRGASPIDYLEQRNRLIGPIFSLSVRGKF